MYGCSNIEHGKTTINYKISTSKFQIKKSQQLNNRVDNNNNTVKLSNHISNFMVSKHQVDYLFLIYLFIYS